ncbi:MAG: DNA repair protein RecO, partial [Planctomycetota bacterium]
PGRAPTGVSGRSTLRAAGPAGARRRSVRGSADRALLLRRTPFGETSLVVHVLTPRGGRVELIAKGAHRPKSRFAGVLDWFDTLALSWTAKREGELGTLREGSLVERRRRLTRSLGAYRAAQTVVELLDLATRAGGADPELFGLGEAALDGLDALGEEQDAPHTALLASFELHLLDHLGLAPSLTACASCGGPAPPVDPRATELRVPFSAAAGGRLCANHANEAHAAGVRVGTLPSDVLGAAAAALAAPVSGAGTLGWSRDVSERVLDFSARFLDHHLEARPRSHAAFLSAPDRNRRSAAPRRP